MYRILICDDEKDIVSALKIYLSSEGYETRTAYTGKEALEILEQEETQLNVTFNEALKEIEIKLMGDIQLEIIKHQIKQRFDIDVEFLQGRIVYKETIKSPSYGVGHYEPLRHYSEVHLYLEPLPQGSGTHVRRRSSCRPRSQNHSAPR